MHLRTSLYTCILLFTLGLAAQAGSVPELISHQGRLLKTDGTPETGAHSLTFTVYEVSSGGVALWTESHPGVVVDEGLFTVLLGSTVPVSSDLLSPPSSGSPVERWLEVTVDGQVLSPRMRLASVPYAASSSRMDGDVETSPGELRLHGMSGSTTGTIRMTASDGGNEDSTQLYLYARKNGQFTSADFDYKATSSRSSLTVGTDEDGDAHHENQLTATATFSDGSTMDITSDPDEDGTPNGQAQMKSKGSSGGIRLGGMSGSTTGTIRMAASPDSTYEDHSSLDALGYGGTRRGMNSNVRSTALLGVDRGLRQTSYEETCDSSSARGILSGMSGSTTGTIRMMASPDSVSSFLDLDADNDGIPDIVEGSSVTAGGVHHVLSGMSGSTTGTIRMAASPDSTVDYLDMDSDDDGVSDASSKTKVTGSSASSSLSHMSGSTTGTIRMSASASEIVDALDIDDDGDMISDRSIEMHVAPSTTSMAIKTKGTGAQRSSQSMESWGDSSGTSMDMDSDGDGVAEKYYVTGCTHDKVSTLLASDSDDDGVIDRSVTSDCDDTDARLVVANIGSSGQDGVSIECDASSRRVRMGNLGSSGQDGVDMEVTSTLRRLTVGNIGSSGQDGVGIEVDASSRRLTVGNIGSSGQDGVSIDVGSSSSKLVVHNIGSSGQDGVSIIDDGSGGRIGVDTIPTANKITVKGGAYCDGTTWSNASDVAAKENFARVDGEELLEQIADLEITRWNYKSQPGVEHIGPTAQDFQAAFGVGANDKSISTIDPSGIALAAIKELQKQNAELRAQLEALNRKVESLSATR